MTIAIRAAIAILSIASFGTAYADSVGGTPPITFFNQLPGVAEKPPMQNVPAAATARGRGACLRHPVEPRHVAVWVIPWR